MPCAVAGQWLREHPGLVPLVFAIINASRPAKMRAHATIMALLLVIIVEMLSALGWSGVSWGLVAPPAVVAGIGVPLYLAALQKL